MNGFDDPDCPAQSPGWTALRFIRRCLAILCGVAALVQAGPPAGAGQATAVIAGSCSYRGTACRSRLHKPHAEDAAGPAATPAPIPIPVPKPNPLDASRSAIAVPVSPIEGAAESAPETPSRAVDANSPVKSVHDAMSLQGDACLKALSALNVRFLAMSPLAVTNPACQVTTPVSLLSVATAHARVDFPDHPFLRCGFALQFVAWVKAVAATTPMTALTTGPGFQCRGRRGDGSGKISEHAVGDAVDVTTIAMSDHVVQVADAAAPATRDYPLLRTLRASACGYFTTVLGPGTNSAHARHFHLDLAVHGHNRDYRICE